MLAMCHRMEGCRALADKDFRTQYEWAKAWSWSWSAWNKKRFRGLGQDVKEWSETDKDKDSRDDTDKDEDSREAGFHEVAGKALRRTTRAPWLKRKRASTHRRPPRPRRQA